MARRGELVEALRHPAMLARANERLVGVATYILDGDACELLTLHAVARRSGVGTALVDNVDALRFYQRRGFRLAGLRPGAVDRSRDTVKPEIPAFGDHGIPLRDEIELEMSLGPA